MAQSTGIVLAAGGVTAANELLFAPLAGEGTPWKDFNWRIIPATAVVAVAMAGLEKLSPRLAVGLSVTMLITAMTVQFGKSAPPIANIAKTLGYAGKVA
jgi:hypothetical protein